MAGGAGEPREVQMGGRPSLAVRVRDGDGVPVVLLHGLGRTLEDWECLAPLLATRHPVLSVDLRGHGLSDDGAWTLDGFVDDLIRVIGYFGLEHPVIAGHGAGGMVAAACASRRHDLTAVVGIGYRRPLRAARLADRLGLPPGRAQDQIGAVSSYIVEEMVTAITPMPAETFGRQLEAWARGPWNLPGTVLRTSALRSSVTTDGVVATRPGPRAMRALCAAFDEVDTDAVLGAPRVPTLDLVSTVPVPHPPGAPLRFAEVLAAQAHDDLSRNDAGLTVRGVRVPNTMHMSHPRLVAGVIEEFLAGLRAQTGTTLGPC